MQVRNCKRRCISFYHRWTANSESGRKSYPFQKPVITGFHSLSIPWGAWAKMQKTDKPVLSSDGAKLSLKREALTEWYINQGNNLEHGLVLNEKPSGVGNLKFYFATSGNLTPKQDGNDITFVGKETMNYAGIKAWDAAGRDLVCSMSVDGGKLVWSVDDSGAVYPVTVDPAVSFVKKITASDAQVNDKFGYSVSLSGDLAIVGAYGEDEGGEWGPEPLIFSPRIKAEPVSGAR